MSMSVSVSVSVSTSEKRRKWDVQSQNNREMGCKVAKNERSPDQGDDEDACTTCNNTKMESKIKGEIEGEKKGCPISKNSRKKTQNDT